MKYPAFWRSPFPSKVTSPVMPEYLTLRTAEVTASREGILPPLALSTFSMALNAIAVASKDSAPYGCGSFLNRSL